MPWSQDSLRTLIEEKFRDYQIILVSNREPYMHVYRGGELAIITPAGGMAVALDSLMQSCGGTWIASGSGEADRQATAGQDSIMVPPPKPKYKLRRLWLTPQEEANYYFGFSNQALWPLCHIVYTRPRFLTSHWETYKAVNQKFADAVLSELSDQRTIVFIQDYHFALLPRMLKDANPGLIVCQFWHIPWPNYEVFRICPWGTEILDGLLGNDLLGFHLQYHCNNFFDTVERTLEARLDSEHFTVIRQGKTTWVRPFPISIDFSQLASLAASPQNQPRTQELRQCFNLNDLKIGLGMDRIDYTKGIPERLMAIDHFFSKHPQYQGRFTFIQLGVQSRMQIPNYQALNDRVDALEKEINNKYGKGDWKPVIVAKTHLSREEIVSFYCLADVMVVSSLQDGMNLVAKEFVASRIDGGGALVLSAFTGAARELAGAYTINPYNTEEVAEVIYKALEDSPLEKVARMEAMRSWVEEHNIYHWAAQFLQTLLSLPLV
jgi:alpha,alpha-trehalose-phosphate synthase [UDP-forming]